MMPLMMDVGLTPRLRVWADKDEGHDIDMHVIMTCVMMTLLVATPSLSPKISIVALPHGTGDIATQKRKLFSVILDVSLTSIAECYCWMLLLNFITLSTCHGMAWCIDLIAIELLDFSPVISFQSFSFFFVITSALIITPWYYNTFACLLWLLLLFAWIARFLRSAPCCSNCLIFTLSFHLPRSSASLILKPAWLCPQGCATT